MKRLFYKTAILILMLGFTALNLMAKTFELPNFEKTKYSISKVEREFRRDGLPKKNIEITDNIDLNYVFMPQSKLSYEEDKDLYILTHAVHSHDKVFSATGNLTDDNTLVLKVKCPRLKYKRIITMKHLKDGVFVLISENFSKGSLYNETTYTFSPISESESTKTISESDDADNTAIPTIDSEKDNAKELASSNLPEQK